MLQHNTFEGYKKTEEEKKMFHKTKYQTKLRDHLQNLNSLLLVKTFSYTNQMEG